jgi:hypothetical protein
MTGDFCVFGEFDFLLASWFDGIESFSILEKQNNNQ